MPWVEAVLRGKSVLARAKADGTLLTSGGRVEIRYKAHDSRAYRAMATNLVVPPGAKVFDDAYCVPASEPRAASRAEGKKVATPAAVPAAAWVAYTDGACSGNPGPCGLGVVVVKPGGTQAEGYEYLGTGTNNIAELTAIKRAVEAIPAGAHQIVIHTDSKYAIGVLTQGWRAKANAELVAQIKETLRGRPVRLVYVAGHSGIPLNERADELAREAIRTAGRMALAIK
jgi:ribonuclease HI